MVRESNLANVGDGCEVLGAGIGDLVTDCSCHGGALGGLAGLHVQLAQHQHGLSTGMDP